MKFLFLIAATGFFSLPALAVVEQTRLALERPNDTIAISVIREGTVEANASGVFTLVEGQNALTGFDSTLGAQYFITDEVGIGAQLRLLTNSGIGDALILTPQASYYFYKAGRVAGFVTQAIDFGPLMGSATSISRFGSFLTSSTTLGVDYFLSENISLSPGVTLTANLLGTNRFLTAPTILSAGFNFKLFFQ